jgi:hypothetical protein
VGAEFVQAVNGEVKGEKIAASQGAVGRGFANICGYLRPFAFKKPHLRTSAEIRVHLRLERNKNADDRGYASLTQMAADFREGFQRKWAQRPAIFRK